MQQHISKREMEYFETNQNCAFKISFEFKEFGVDIDSWHKGVAFFNSGSPRKFYNTWRRKHYGTVNPRGFKVEKLK